MKSRCGQNRLKTRNLKEEPQKREISYGKYSCHRVVNHAGRLVPGWREQGFLLEQEGVTLKDQTHVDLRKYQWDGS